MAHRIKLLFFRSSISERSIPRSCNLIATVTLILTSGISVGQDFPNWQARVQLNDSGFVDILQYFQIWNTITLKTPLTTSTPRVDTHIRRARFGLGGQIKSNAQFYVGFTYDGIGKDSLSPSAGIPNLNDNQTFSVRDAFFTYRISSLLNFTIGYFRPRAVKESIYTSAFNISQEKGQPNFQPRIHMVGRAIGRETGLNIGGLKKGRHHSFLYDIGFFDTNHPLIVGNNSVWSPLLTARLVWMIGDPELEIYQLVYHQSGYGKRKGLSLGTNITYQQKTNLFTNNTIYGADAQLNHGPLDFLAEYVWLYRNPSIAGAPLFTTDHSYVIKAAWNFKTNHEQILQISLMQTATIPDKTFKSQAINPYTLAFFHSEWALGLNWLIKRDKLKLGFHFVEGRRYYPDIPDGRPTGIFRYINPSIQWMN